MIEIFFVLVILIIIVGLCLHHHTIQKTVMESFDKDEQQIKEASERSVMAASLAHPLLALVDATRAIQILDSLHERHKLAGTKIVSDIDTHEAVMVYRDQKERILQDIITMNPNLQVLHPYAEHIGMAPEKEPEV